MGQDGIVRLIEGWVREILRCPACRGVLRDGVGEVDGRGEPRPELHCTVCRLGYRIEDGGIPVLLVDEARPIEEE
jgi:uncharacterized protein YbaR (Trm112 family)